MVLAFSTICAVHLEDWWLPGGCNSVIRTLVPRLGAFGSVLSKLAVFHLFLIPLNLCLKNGRFCWFGWFKFKAQFVIFLIQRDNSLARMLFASLFKSVFAEVDHVLTNREAESTKRAVRDGLNAVMEASTQFYPPFIGSLQVSLQPEVWER